MSKVVNDGEFSSITLRRDGSNKKTVLTNEYITANNIKYLFDTNATIFIFKNNDGSIATPTVKSIYTVYGFYNTETNDAILSSTYNLFNFNDSSDSWTHILYIICNGIKFYCTEKNTNIRNTAGDAFIVRNNTNFNTEGILSLGNSTNNLANMYKILYFKNRFSYNSRYYLSYIIASFDGLENALMTNTYLNIKLIDVTMTSTDTSTTTST